MTAGPRTPPLRTAAGWVLAGALAMAMLILAAALGLALLHAVATTIT